MAGLDARFKPGVNVPAFCKTAVTGGRFVKIVDDKTTDGAYQVGHCGLGERSFGVAVADSGPTTQSAHSVERQVNIVRSGAIARVEPGEAISAADEVQSDADGKAIVLGGAVRATLDTGVEEDDNALTWTAVGTGLDGNNITIEIVDAGDAVTALSIDLAENGHDITVNLATTDVDAGAITSIAQDIVDALPDSEASAVVTVKNQGASTGAGLMTALEQTSLAGGADPEGAGVPLGQAVMTVLGTADFVEVALY